MQDPAYTRHKEICIARSLAGEHASFLASWQPQKQCHKNRVKVELLWGWQPLDCILVLILPFLEYSIHDSCSILSNAGSTKQTHSAPDIIEAVVVALKGPWRQHTTSLQLKDCLAGTTLMSTLLRTVIWYKQDKGWQLTIYFPPLDSWRYKSNLHDSLLSTK